MVSIEEERKEIEKTYTGVLKTSALANLKQYEDAINQLTKIKEDNIKAIKGELVKRDVLRYEAPKPKNGG